MGRTEKRELISCLSVLLRRLLEWRYQPGKRRELGSEHPEPARPNRRPSRRQSEPEAPPSPGSRLRLPQLSAGRDRRDGARRIDVPGDMSVGGRAGVGRGVLAGVKPKERIGFAAAPGRLSRPRPFLTTLPDGVFSLPCRRPCATSKSLLLASVAIRLPRRRLLRTKPRRLAYPLTAGLSINRKNGVMGHARMKEIANRNGFSFLDCSRIVARRSAPIIKQEYPFAIVGGLVWPVHRDAVYLRFETASEH